MQGWGSGRGESRVDDGFGRFLRAAGGSGFPEISTEKIGNLDSKEGTENLRTVNGLKYYIEILRLAAAQK